MQENERRHIAQVAFCALDGPGLRRWYANVFGLAKSGRTIFFPPSTTRVQGIPAAWEKCGWLIDSQDYFQLEFFQFWNPHSRLKPVDWRPCDIGYNMLGIAVADFDGTLRNVAAFSDIEPPRVFGKAGDRRACVTDPEGNLVEILERDPLTALDPPAGPARRPEVPAVVRTMRVSVPSLDDARATYVDSMGLEVVDGLQLHNARDEAMWGLKGVKADSIVVRSDNFLLELVQYNAPEPRSWPEGYSIKDQGYMNIALGFRDQRDYYRAFNQATGAGMKPNGRVVDLGAAQVMYVNDGHRFSVEMLGVKPALWGILGFKPEGGYVENEIEINAPAGDVWNRLTDHAGLGDWTLFTGRVLRPGRDHANGTGCIRELTAPGMRILEEVTAWDEGRHYAYQLRSGAPFRWHQGDVFVAEDGEGRCRVRWAIRFDTWIPLGGKPISWVLGLIFRRGLRSLKQRLETYQLENKF